MTTDLPDRSPEQLRAHVAEVLTRSRERSTLLTDAVDDDDLVRQHSPLMSPLVWDLAHVGNQEELWLVRDVGAREPVRQDIDELYDAFKHSRADRPALPLLSPPEARAYVREVRDKVLDVLDHAPLEGRRLLEHAFAFGMVAQHEQQHAETMLATHQLRRGDAVLTGAAATPGRHAARRPRGPRAGRLLHHGHLDRALGPRQRATGAPGARRRLRPRRRCGDQRRLRGLRRRRRLRRPALVVRGRLGAPPDVRDRRTPLLGAPGRRMVAPHSSASLQPLPPHQPVVHVSFYEAEAYAAWAGRRLPTEAEWEKAARHDPSTGRSRRYPWGDEDPTPAHANLGQRHLAPAEAGAYPAGASPLGVHQLIGDVWEWTSSDFRPYPGFAAFPYDEYSLVFFGTDYKVLRGGSFGTDAVACRGTFRNWDYPIRRQIFAGFRCARDPRPEELD